MMKTVTELYNLSSEVVGSGPFEDDEPMWITNKRYEWIQTTIMMLTCQDFVALAEQLWHIEKWVADAIMKAIQFPQDPKTLR